MPRSNPTGEVTIGMVGKYIELPDAYKSINEALKHAGPKPFNCEHRIR